MRYRVRHATAYDYAPPVDLAVHIVHLRPRTLPHQAVPRCAVTVHPAPSRARTGTDHFGNEVDWLSMEAPHARFTVTLDALVDVDFPTPPAPGFTPPWESVAHAAATAWREAEYTFDSPMIAGDADTRAYVARSFPAGRPILEAMLELNGRIRRDFDYRSGVTTIATPVARVMAQRAGVCQDFAHLMIAGLRGLGLPARYVSGYLRTYPPEGSAALRGADQSHAWVGAWLGPGHGWIDLDPTNDLVVAREHVVLGWGRDYGDVSPVRGVLLGGSRHTVSVAVSLEPA